jgi:AraC-like DNA-binding protein
VEEHCCYLLSAGRRFFFSAESPRISLLYCEIADGHAAHPRACDAPADTQADLLAANARARATSLSAAPETEPELLKILDNAISHAFGPATGVRCDEPFQKLLTDVHGGDLDRPGPDGLLADMSRACGLSERTIQLRFRRLLGTSPLEYVRNARLDRARRSLSRPDGPTRYSEVAEELGFTNLSRFASAYERRHGMRPVDTIRNRRPPRSS